MRVEGGELPGSPAEQSRQEGAEQSWRLPGGSGVQPTGARAPATLRRALAGARTPATVRRALAGVRAPATVRRALAGARAPATVRRVLAWEQE